MTAPEPLFICGAAKSGTTWVQRLLDGHPDIACNGEAHLPDDLACRMYDALHQWVQRTRGVAERLYGDREAFPQLDGNDLVSILRHTGDLLFGKIAGDRDVRLVGDKTPENVRHLDMLSTIFPDALFVNVVRDGRDTAVSGWHAQRKTDPDWLGRHFVDFADYAEHVARLWVQDVEAAEFNVDAAAIHVTYERLVAAPEQTVTYLLHKLDQRIDAEAVQACLTAGDAAKDAPHFRAGRVGDWRTEMDAATVQAFEKIAGPTLARWGYEVSTEVAA